MKWKTITFTRAPYRISDTGQLWSPLRNRIVQGRHLMPGNPRISYDFYIEGIGRKSVLRNRLVYFFFVYYPKFLKQQGQEPSWENFLKMPLVIHQDGNKSNDVVTNLLPHVPREELRRWAGKRFPLKMGRRRLQRVGSIDQMGKTELVTGWLKNGLSYREIAGKIKVSEMCVFRFAINRGLRERKEVRTLTEKEKQYIRSKVGSTTQKAIAQKLNVGEHTVSRFLKRHRQQSAPAPINNQTKLTKQHSRKKQRL